MDFQKEKYWNDYYLARDTPWDIGYASPPLAEYINKLTEKDLRILIPGCGNAHEATYLLQKGFKNLTLIDISTVLAENLRNRLSTYNPHVNVLAGDFFELEDQFDLILEQTFFCALDPSLRPAYVKKMFEVLKPGGTLAGVLFNREFIGGPPFGGSVDEYRGLFEPHFKINILAPCYNSIEPRMGSEVFFEVVKQ